MIHSTLFKLALLFLPFIHGQQDIKTLTTTLLSDNVVQGNYWDVVAFNAISIVRLEFNTNGCAGTYLTRLWKRTTPGGYAGFENNRGAWTLVTEQDVGCNVTTPNAALNDINIQVNAGDRQALFLYIQRLDLTDTTVALAQGNEGDPLVANTDLAVLIGTVVATGDPEFQRTTSSLGQQTNLIVFYVLGTVSPTMAPSLPTQVPTLSTATPTRNPTPFGFIPSRTRSPALPPINPAFAPVFRPTTPGGGKGKGKRRRRNKGGKQRRRNNKGGMTANKPRPRNGGIIPFGRPRGSGGNNNNQVADGSTFRGNLKKLADFIYGYAFNSHHSKNYDAIYGYGDDYFAE